MFTLLLHRLQFCVKALITQKTKQNKYQLIFINGHPDAISSLIGIYADDTFNFILIASLT